MCSLTETGYPLLSVLVVDNAELKRIFNFVSGARRGATMRATARYGLRACESSFGRRLKHKDSTASAGALMTDAWWNGAAAADVVQWTFIPPATFTQSRFNGHFQIRFSLHKPESIHRVPWRNYLYHIYMVIALRRHIVGLESILSLCGVPYKWLINGLRFWVIFGVPSTAVIRHGKTPVILSRLHGTMLQRLHWT